MHSATQGLSARVAAYAGCQHEKDMLLRTLLQIGSIWIVASREYYRILKVTQMHLSCNIIHEKL